ncbi:MAG: hypothetical protein OHK0013_42680 [Sandaracinaceae bacterium]
MCATLGVAAAGTARAHLGHVVLRAERYLKLDASDADTRLVVSLTLGAEEGRRLLEGADANRDGSVSQAEADGYMGQWGDGLAAELPVELDGVPVPLVWGEPFLDPIGPVRAVPVTVEMVAHLPTGAREHTVVVRDRMVRREVFDRTDVAFRAHDGAELVACGSGPEPTGRQASLSYGRAAGPPVDAISARFRYPLHPTASAGWSTTAIVLACVLAALSSVLGLRRAARRRLRAPENGAR